MSDASQMPQPPKPKWTAGAVAMFVIGLLILIPSGLCTGVMGIGALVGGFSSGHMDDVLGFLAMVLIVGGPFVAGGMALTIAGWRSRKDG